MKRIKLGAFVAVMIGVIVAITVASSQSAQSMINRPEPKDGSSLAKTWPIAKSGQALVAAGTKEAVDAGIAIINQGGTAMDAAVAIQATLSLTEPQSSGIGGGAFMLYYDAKTKKTTVYYGRETAPMSTGPERFLKDDKSVMTYAEAVTGGRATGVPGAMHMLEHGHNDHGKLSWKRLFDEPIRLARDGYFISNRTARFLQSTRYPQSASADLKAHFSDGQGGLKKAGDFHTNPEMARTLGLMANNGMSVFREGPLAQAIVARVNEAPYPGGMTIDDLKSYRVKTSEPVCVIYRVVYRVCSALPPSGGVSVLHALKIVERFPVNSWGPKDVRSWQVILEAERRMYADRDQYMADPDFVSVPVQGLLADDYIAARASEISLDTAMPAPKFGMPKDAPLLGKDKTSEGHGTTHFVVVDKVGNAVSMTTTVESIFGSGRMVGGFFLNNQLTDFSWSPMNGEAPAANAAAGGKRPRSAMSPLMVFDQKGRLIAMMGSPGGQSILSYNLKTLVAMLDFNMGVQEAIDLSHIIAKGNSIRVEAGRMDKAIIEGLKDKGYKLDEVAGEESGLNGVKRLKKGSFEGGTDPRREGIVAVTP
jgi:gamma-glutamyltranspeptidase/glutathione hydrolase